MINDSPILLAEDDENDVFFFQRAARTAGLTNSVQVVRDGQEAIDYLSGVGKFGDRKKHPLPCIVILDLKMPRRTGLEVLEWVQTAPGLVTLPVIVLSSSAQRDDIEQAYRLGANAFVVKPPSVEKRNELAALIKGFWLQFNHPPLHCLEAALARS